MRRFAAIPVAALLAVAAPVQAEETLTRNDYTEIHELYARYAQAIDRGDADAYAGVFTEDGVFTIGTDFVRKGKEEIAAIVSGPRRERPKITHFYSNIMVDPSPEGAKGSVYVILIDLQKTPAITGGGYCDDILVRTKEGWRFKNRACHLEPGPPNAPAQSSAR